MFASGDTTLALHSWEVGQGGVRVGGGVDLTQKSLVFFPICIFLNLNFQ